MKVDAWVVTMWPEEHVIRALGPDDPDEEEAALLFLTKPAADHYRDVSAPAGSSVVQVSVEIKVQNPPPSETNWAAADAGFAVATSYLRNS